MFDATPSDRLPLAPGCGGGAEPRGRGRAQPARGRGGQEGGAAGQGGRAGGAVPAAAVSALYMLSYTGV